MLILTHSEIYAFYNVTDDFTSDYEKKLTLGTSGSRLNLSFAIKY